MKHLKELLIESIADLKDLLVEYLTSENLSVKEVAQLLNSRSLPSIRKATEYLEQCILSNGFKRVKNIGAFDSKSVFVIFPAERRLDFAREFVLVKRISRDEIKCFVIDGIKATSSLKLYTYEDDFLPGLEIFDIEMEKSNRAYRLPKELEGLFDELNSLQLS